jgi:hypothetical protein
VDEILVLFDRSFDFTVFVFSVGYINQGGEMGRKGLKIEVSRVLRVLASIHLF